MNRTIPAIGSSRGIGRAIALAENGYDIVVHGRSRRAEAGQNSRPECTPRPRDVVRNSSTIGKDADMMALEDRYQTTACGAKTCATAPFGGVTLPPIFRRWP
ncbi:MAG: hypothetical protein Q4A06_02950 [Cardiobacteriaceae bacterium]|nr:hypothetical protein [Cardiobacteriaceae bacterium]